MTGFAAIRRAQNFWRSLATDHQMLLGICAGLTFALILFTCDAYFKGKRADERKRKRYHKIRRQVERSLRKKEAEGKAD